MTLYTTDTPTQRLAGELRTAKADGLLRAKFSVLDVESVLAVQQPNRAPSDTDLLSVLIEQQRPDSEQRPDGHWAVYGRRMARVIDNLARTPQPVQVEVTEDMVRVGATAGLDAVQPTWRATGSEPSPDDLNFTRAALSAALGGGEQ